MYGLSNEELERSVLKGYIHSKKMHIALTDFCLESWFFHDRDCNYLFSVAKSLAHRCDFESLIPRISKDQKAMSILSSLALEASLEKNLENDSGNFWYKLNEYRKESKSRKASELILAIRDKVLEGKVPSELYDDLNVLAVGEQDDVVSAEQAIDIMQKTPVPDPYETNVHRLDEACRVVPSSLLVIGGQSSSGKTAIANQAVYAFLCNYMHSRVLYFNLETEQIRLMRRFSLHAQFIDGMTREAANLRLKGFGERLLIVKKIYTIQGMIKKIRDELKKKDGLKFVVIDYLQIVEVEGHAEWTPTMRVSFVIRELHKLAQETELVVIVLSQLRRGEKSKDGKTLPPTMDDLRETTTIQNAADYIWINWFTSEYKPMDGTPRQVRIEIVKNKEGAQGHVDLDFHGKFLTFTGRIDP